jgi:serine/threonine protein phosphatase PrpC
MKIEQALEMASLTHPGRVRAHNEDSLSCEPSCGLAVLADGMGGYNAGEVASGITVSVLTTEIRNSLQSVRPEDKNEQNQDIATDLLSNNVQKANASIFHAAQSQPQYAGMGTTVVAGLFYDNRVAVAHVGDSRMYRLRGDEFEALTRDHSLLQEQIDSGMISKEDARLSRNKNLVTRAVGIDSEVSTEVHVHDVEVGDIYLLCSDGLNDMVEDEQIGGTLRALRSNMSLAVSQLVKMANDNGGRDNISVILVKVHSDFPAPHGFMSKVRAWFKN